MANLFYCWQKLLSRVGLGTKLIQNERKKKENNKLENNELKKNTNFSPEALQLFKALEKEAPKIKDLLINSYKGIPTSPEVEEEVYNYCVTHSVIFAVTTSNPGTSLLTEFLYEGISSPSPLDNYFLQCKAGKAVKARLLAIEKELPRIIEEYLSTRKEIIIGSLGSGPGRDIIEVFSKYYRNNFSVKAILIDKNKTVLERGKRMAAIKKVENQIEFIEGNFLKYKPPRKFDIVLLIGILCPLTFETCITILKRIKKTLKKGGCLIASNVSEKMLKEDPFTYHIMKWGANWKMIFKNEKELKKIFEKAGYMWRGCFSDAYGFHIIGKGIPRFYF